MGKITLKNIEGCSRHERGVRIQKDYTGLYSKTKIKTNINY